MPCTASRSETSAPPHHVRGPSTAEVVAFLRTSAAPYKYPNLRTLSTEVMPIPRTSAGNSPTDGGVLRVAAADPATDWGRSENAVLQAAVCSLHR